MWQSTVLIDAGMLGSAATIKMLAQALTYYKVEKLVLDPVRGKWSNHPPCHGKYS
jgi:hydroxymethylpyrimidine/phosphomethylpyrimidine kinase